jgi:hypothetical protein
MIGDTPENKGVAISFIEARAKICWDSDQYEECWGYRAIYLDESDVSGALDKLVNSKKALMSLQYSKAFCFTLLTLNEGDVFPALITLLQADCEDKRLKKVRQDVIVVMRTLSPELCYLGFTERDFQKLKSSLQKKPLEHRQSIGAHVVLGGVGSAAGAAAGAAHLYYG